jgi:hypothetical protein
MGFSFSLSRAYSFLCLPMSSCWRVGLPAFVSDVIDALILIHHVLEDLSPLVFVSDLIDGEMDNVNLFRHGAVISKHMSSVHKKETQYPSIHRTTIRCARYHTCTCHTVPYIQTTGCRTTCSLQATATRTVKRPCWAMCDGVKRVRSFVRLFWWLRGSVLVGPVSPITRYRIFDVYT